MKIRKTAAVILTFVMLIQNAVFAAEPPKPEGKAAILMEASTGKVLMEMNADEPLPPALPPQPATDTAVRAAAITTLTILFFITFSLLKNKGALNF